LPEAADPEERRALEELQAALAALDRALYGRDVVADRASLDAALNSALAATKRLRSKRMWPKPQLRRLVARQPMVERRA
jgi:hypothetical protein